MSFYRKEPACKTYWLLEERRDDTALSPEMPLRSPPLFAHMLTKDRGNESSFQPVVVRMGDDEAFSFQVSVKRTSRKVKSTQEWGWDRVIETEEFFVTNLGPGTILCGGRPLAPQASGSGNRVELMSAKRPLDMRHVTVGDVQCNASCGERISCDGLNKGSECGQNALPQMAFLVVSDEEGDPKQGANYRFYTGKLPSKPDGAYVREFHEEWFGDYQRLEEEHGFIQWLFPLFLNSGVNWEASRLGRGEARLIRRDLVAAKNVVESYRLMLDFYGLKLADARTGRIEYADNECVRRRQLENLNYSSHNYLRITRILTSLGQLGFTRYKKPFIVALERVVKDAVPNARRSLQDYWKATLDYDTENYRRETLEIPEDREPSVFFATLESAQAPLPVVVIATTTAAAAVETNRPEPDNHSCDENLLPPVQTDECKEPEDVPKASDNCVSVQQEESKPNVDMIAKPKNEPENEPENEGEESNTEKNDNENKDKDCEDERQQQ